VAEATIVPALRRAQVPRFVAALGAAIADALHSVTANAQCSCRSCGYELGPHPQDLTPCICGIVLSRPSGDPRATRKGFCS
jgi:hypothetical protein